MESYTEKYLSMLKSSGLSNTNARRAVFNLLIASNHKPLSSSEIIFSCSDSADRASVYRNIEALTKAGVIQKIYTGWKYKLELSDAFHGHHHHLICTNCGDIRTIENDQVLESSIDRLSAEYKFKAKDHRIEIFGICKDCN